MNIIDYSLISPEIPYDIYDTRDASDLSMSLDVSSNLSLSPYVPSDLSMTLDVSSDLLLSSYVPSDLSMSLDVFSDLSLPSDVPSDLPSNLLMSSDVSSDMSTDASTIEDCKSDVQMYNNMLLLYKDNPSNVSKEQPIVPSSLFTDRKQRTQISSTESLTDLLCGIRISFDGNHNDMTLSWSQEELKVRRRVVQFFKSKIKKRIMASFRAVDPIERPKNGIFVSCLYWNDRKTQRDKWYFTSTDYLNLLESLTGIRLTSDEKNRIRRNLEEYKPITVGKNKNDSDDIYKDLMSYSFAKPRNAEKDIKIYEWRHLIHAIEKIINKYSGKKTIKKKI
ncbi:hypothetical protein RclHR1_01340004 [Rhizophagus clarus]|uniref:Transcriptional regulator medusa n=1 Tax=Rhizophagus clarus TaxID=94130 RepID=A0A2Z6Q9U8_9GLOM|nr:hypothetical protein RclHR1_01340004 [Rhizophagus clarus]GES77548.1 transcriptional regulator medusa [Rhizophagus clarus]